MLHTKRVLAGVLAAVALSVSGALVSVAPANATVEYPEGGTWNYGVAGYPGATWSNYHHPWKKHRSTACNTSFCQRSADANGGVWSKVTVSASLNNNRAYYYNY